MMLDIAAAREAFRDEIIYDIGLIRTKWNIADGVTKQTSQVSLREVLSTGKLNLISEQCIIRMNFASVNTQMAGNVDG